MTAGMLVASPSKINWYNNDIGVPSFILSGAPMMSASSWVVEV
jgi:hypothetical protein